MNNFPTLLGCEAVASGIALEVTLPEHNGAVLLSGILNQHNELFRYLWKLRGFIMMRDKKEYDFVLLMRYENMPRCRYKHGKRRFVGKHKRWILYALPAGSRRGPGYVPKWNQVLAEVEKLPYHYDSNYLDFSPHYCGMQPFLLGGNQPIGYENT